MAYKKGILDSVEALWLIGVTLASIIAVLGIKTLYARRNRIIRRLKSFSNNWARRRVTRKIFVLLDKRPTDQLAKIAFSLLVWPKYGFPDSLLYLPRPPHYKQALKMETPIAADLKYPLTDLALEELPRKDLLTLGKTLAQKRSLLSLRWMLSFLEGRSAGNEQKRNHAAGNSSASGDTRPNIRASVSMADLQDSADSTLSSGLVDLCPAPKADRAPQWRECGTGLGPPPAAVKVRRFKGSKTGAYVLISYAIIERVTTKLKNDESNAGADVSALVENLLWDYLGRPEDLLDE
jgi:hypothetical protein